VFCFVLRSDVTVQKKNIQAVTGRCYGNKILKKNDDDDDDDKVVAWSVTSNCPTLS